MRKFLILLVLFVMAPIFAAKQVLNIYVWSDYLPPKVIKQFENQSGISVNISEFDGNDALFTKLKAAPNAGYDIIQPSSYYVERMAKEHMLQMIDKHRLTNFKYLNPLLLNRPFDPHNNYSVPYLWGTTGIVINKKYPRLLKITSWKEFWNLKYGKPLKNQLLMLDDMREVFAIAMLTLGYSINDTNPRHIRQAYLKLKQLMPRIKLFNADALRSIYIDEDVVIGMGWSGDISNAQQENPNLLYIYPKDGFGAWMDCWAIPKHAPNLNNAYKFLNFLLQPKIAKEVSIHYGYTSPNLAAIRLLPKTIYNDSTIYPSKKVLQRAHFMRDLGKARNIYAKYWELLKIGA